MSKTYFFYFTHLFLQNTHISLSIIHIYLNKIFNSLTQPNSHCHHHLSPSLSRSTPPTLFSSEPTQPKEQADQPKDPPTHNHNQTKNQEKKKKKKNKQTNKQPSTQQIGNRAWVDERVDLMKWEIWSVRVRWERKWEIESEVS